MKLYLTDEFKQDFERYKKLSLKLIQELIKEGTYNPFHKKHILKINDIMAYASQCGESHNAFHVPMDEKKKDFFQSLKKFEMTDEQIIDIDLASIFHNIFKFYAIIELSLDVFLEGAIYHSKIKNKKIKIKGTETLGKLKDIINEILPNSDFMWDEIDVKFRNAIAHGSYFVKNKELTYYDQSKFTNPLKMNTDELYDKSVRLNLMSVAVTGAIRRWDVNPDS